MSRKFTTKVRDALGVGGANALLYHMATRLNAAPADAEAWRPFYTRDLDKMLKGMDSSARRKMRLTLQRKRYMQIKGRWASRGRPEYLWRMSDANLAAIQKSFGVIAHDGKPLELPDPAPQGDRPGLTPNVGAVANALENIYTHNDEVRRREAEAKAKQKQEETESDGKGKGPQTPRDQARKGVDGPAED